MKRLSIMIFLLFALVIVAGCTDTTTTTTLQTTTTLTTTTIAQPATTLPVVTSTTLEGVKEFTITAQKFKFIPNEITVTRGDIVKLHITSLDVDHGFALTSFGINEKIKPNQVTDIEFIATKTGNHPFFSNVFSGAGYTKMVGTLIVNQVSE